MSNPENDEGEPESTALTIQLCLGTDAAGERLDKALAAAATGHPDLSRSRLVQLIADGAVTGPDGATVRAARHKVKDGNIGTWTVALPPPAPAEPEAEDIPLDIVHEDADLIVIDKPAGMVVHPAPGAESGTLVNALLHHCGESLTGIGGVGRPGIVHRIDKGTSGLLVVAKTAAAHAHLAALFAAHDIERVYTALLWGAPDAAEPRLAGLPGVHFRAGQMVIDRPVGRHAADRKRMAVRSDGRRAVTRLQLRERLAEGHVSLVECRLETGRTHQIRVHAAWAGLPLVGDPVYGRGRNVPCGLPEKARTGLLGLTRQALHASRLGFIHPVSGASLSFHSPLPPDLMQLLTALHAE